MTVGTGEGEGGSAVLLVLAGGFEVGKEVDAGVVISGDSVLVPTESPVGGMMGATVGTEDSICLSWLSPTIAALGLFDV
jgi:hypothetical protein